ncbi:hypothetical protein L1987_02577 [Smallanthus sonchifolius]|uniref:Uncharacterized protein n=1 Tax=Smallanthus sonchifolius TaxID=185202 RepID=A0ACB9K8D5_9ASTR|nr:hypothetical protein L1987_02577 [Smallanthus sonchifolius]
MANKKSKKGAANKENVARKEETHDHNETRQEAEKDKGTSKDLVGSLDKRMADVEASVTQIGILVDGSLEKQKALGTSQTELDGLREYFKAAIKFIHLELEAMIKREIERLRNEVELHRTSFPIATLVTYCGKTFCFSLVEATGEAAA